MKKICCQCKCGFKFIKARKFCCRACFYIYRKNQRISQFPHDLTEDQKEIITGNLLGDGCISYIKKRNRDTYFSIVQSWSKLDYLKFIKKMYSPFSLRIKPIKTIKPIRIKGKISHDAQQSNEFSYIGQLCTVVHPIFTKLRSKWYKFPYEKRSPKVIPQDLKLTWQIAAFWACDDGSNAVKYSRCFTLHTECFTESEVEFLIRRLKVDLGVCGKLIKRSDSRKPIICFYGNEQDKFVLGIKPFIKWKCFEKKCTRKEIKESNVIFSNKYKKWTARINIARNNRIHLGYFKNKREAESALKTAKSMKALGIKDRNRYIALRPVLRTNNKTGVCGLYYYGKKWLANIRINRVKMHLGSFEDRGIAIKVLGTANQMKQAGIVDMKRYMDLC